MTAQQDLRDAANPLTSGGRVKRLLQIGSPRARLLAVGNPALPVKALSCELLAEPGRGFEYHEAAWRNPSTPLAMLVHPDPLYPRQALRFLRVLEARRCAFPLQRPHTLPDAIDVWAACQARSVDHDHVRAFAQHLAGLFSLPWPKEAR